MQAADDAYTRLLALLDEEGARYRLIDHEPEGRTELVSAMRGNTLAQAAKCMVLIVKQGKRVTRFVVAVVPGDMQVDLDAVKRLLGATYVSIASREVAEARSGAQAGTILPFAFSDGLELIADPRLVEQGEIFFNAGRLDRSVALHTPDYLALARPRLERIAREQVQEARAEL